MNEEKKQTEIRSNEVQEILGGVPSWIVRYGVLAILFVFLFIVLGSWVYKSPDIIRSKIVVTTERPPAPIIARATGKIDKLFVADNQKVRQGDVIALIENPANYGDILKLKAKINELKGFIDLFVPSDSTVVFEKNLQLGALQDEFSSFIKKYNDYLSFLKLDYYPRMNSTLEQQKRMSRIHYDRLWTQKDIFEKEYALSYKQFSRDSSLYAKSLISPKEFEQSKATMLNKKNLFEGARVTLAEMQTDNIEIDQRILENQKNHLDQKNKSELEVAEAFQNLTGALSEWELTYLLTTSVEGTVSFNKFWSETQNVKEGDRVVTVIPDNPGGLVGKVELPLRGSGKVKAGLNVNVKFDNYPYMEYGMVKGIVKNISLVPENNFYMAEVFFPGGLVTTYGKSLELQTEISGSAEIITDELRLLQRFFNPLKALWQEHIFEKK